MSMAQLPNQRLHQQTFVQEANVDTEAMDIEPVEVIQQPQTMQPAPPMFACAPAVPANEVAQKMMHLGSGKAFFDSAEFYSKKAKGVQTSQSEQLPPVYPTSAGVQKSKSTLF